MLVERVYKVGDMVEIKTNGNKRIFQITHVNVEARAVFAYAGRPWNYYAREWSTNTYNVCDSWITRRVESAELYERRPVPA